MRFSARYLIIGLATLLVAACGGDGFTTDGGTAGVGDTSAATIQLIVSTPQLPSDAVSEERGVTVSAIVRDANNNLLPDITVAFSVDSGAIAPVNDGTTDASGTATAILTTAGDPQNRTITVTAWSGNASAVAEVQVTGTQLTISGPDALALGDSAEYSINLTDAGGNGIAGETIQITSAQGNVLSVDSATTDSNGQVLVALTGAVSGEDTLTATGLGLAAQQAVSISDDTFEFVAPAVAAEIDLGDIAVVQVQWLKNGVPQVGQTISFSATRGTLSTSSAITDASGVASIIISATNAGPSVITAQNDEGTTTSREVEFIATTPDLISVEADPFTIAPGETSTITAVVYDPNGNLVKNQDVTFQLDDVTGGEISVVRDRTDSQGRARTVYTASSTSSAVNGVTITATVDGTSISSSVQLTVAEREAFVSIYAGAPLEVPDTTRYQKLITVTVTDINSAAISGVDVRLKLVAGNYFKGQYVAVYDENDNFVGWAVVYNATCSNEDVNLNGVLDPGEDVNGNGSLEPGAPASLSDGVVTTDSEGTASFYITWGKNYAYWAELELIAEANVAGTESSAREPIELLATVDDMETEGVPPSGRIEGKYGTASSCADPN